MDRKVLIGRNKAPKASIEEDRPTTHTEEMMKLEFMAASREGKVDELVVLLSRSMFEADFQEEETLYTSLMYAAENDQIAVVQILLQNGANPNKKNKEGNTALHCACLKNAEQTAVALVERGADPYIENSAGWTAFEKASAPLQNQILAALERYFKACATNASTSTLSGEGIHSATSGVPSRFYIFAFDGFGRRRNQGGDKFMVTITDSDGHDVEHHFTDNHDGTYSVIYIPTVVGEYNISVTLGGQELPGGPWKAQISASLDSMAKALRAMTENNRALEAQLKERSRRLEEAYEARMTVEDKLRNAEEKLSELRGKIRELERTIEWEIAQRHSAEEKAARLAAALAELQRRFGLLGDAKVMKYGWFYKRGPRSGSSFKRRYGVLSSNGELRYFAEKGCINLRTLTGVAPSNQPGSRERGAIELASKERTWVLAFDTKEQTEQWSRLLEHIIATQQSGKLENEPASG